MAREFATTIGREVELARTNLGLTPTAAARLANVAPGTQRRVEAGDPTVSIDVMCRVAAALGLKAWGKAFPAATPSLRDTGQLAIAEHLRAAVSTAFRTSMEHAVGNARAIDLVLFGTSEIICVEIERLLADWQAQYRAADVKRTELAASHQRPVRLVMAVEDTRRNRAVVQEHATLIRSMLPTGTRPIMRMLRSGGELGGDGLLWVRPARRR